MPQKTSRRAFWLMFTNPPTPERREPKRETFTFPTASICSPQRGEVEPAAIIEVKLGRLIDDCLRMNRGPKAEAACGHSADRSAFDGQCDLVQQPALGSDPGDPLRMPIPRFAIAPGTSSSHARAAMIRRSSSGIGDGTGCVSPPISGV